MQRASAEGGQKIQNILLDQVQDALFIIDEVQEILYANRAAKQFFGDDIEVIGRQLIEVCLDHNFVQIAERAMQSQSLSPIQDKVKLATTNRTVLIEAGAINSNYQIGQGGWMMVRDITTELHTEQVRQDFVANASHELRTPLSIIKGYLEMIEDDPKYTQAVGIMSKHTDRLARIVDDMLLISRVESADGDMVKKEVLFDIGDCIEDIIQQLQPVIDEQNAKVKVMLPPDSEDRNFLGDRFYWDQIFFNLIENALKQNTHVAALKIEVVVKKKAKTNQFLIKVVDNGIGIPRDALREVFKRFYRVEKSHSQQKIKGTGLGLSIVKRAVEAHYGSIHVESQPGYRTRFIISVPGPPPASPQES